MRTLVRAIAVLRVALRSPKSPLQMGLIGALLFAGSLATTMQAGSAEPGTLERLETTPIPPRDPLDIYARLTGMAANSIPRVVNDDVPDYEVGRVDQFWIGNQITREYRQAPAVLRLKTAHAYWYVEQSRVVDDQALQRSADYFEAHTYSTVRMYYGSEWFPGIDNDPHITILMARVPGVGAYFSSWDEYPRTVYVHSNQREMVHMNLDAIQPGGRDFDGVLAHEFQHMVHWYSNPNDETWVDEGSSELSTNLVLGSAPLSSSSYQANPDTQLTGWSDQPGDVSAHYDAAFLFMRYFIDRYGGPTILYDLIAQHARGTDLFDRFLAATGREERFAEIFGDWTVANFVNDPTLEGGKYGQPSVNLRPRIAATVKVGDPAVPYQVHQFGVDYVELQGTGGDATVSFKANPTVRLVGTDPASGQHMWWSNRADGMDSTLTREIDLTNVSAATLTFKTWYEIELDYDYLYVTASTDGGKSWSVLQGTGMSTTNPTGNAIGPGYTGVSGGGDVGQWVDGQVDLSAYAGKKVLLRLEYVTDQAFNRSGAVIDDIQIPEIGLADDSEQDGGWESSGFFRSDNSIPESYQVRLITFDSNGTHVSSVPVDAEGSGVATIPGLSGETSRAVLVVSATAPRTLEVSHYSLSLAGS